MTRFKTAGTWVCGAALAAIATTSTGCKTRGDRLLEEANRRIAAAADDPAKGLQGAAAVVFIEGFYDTKAEASGSDGAFEAAITLTRNERNYIPDSMESYRDGHLAEQGIQILQLATLGGPLGLKNTTVTIKVDVESAGGVVDILQLQCPTDAVLAAAPAGLEPFEGKMDGEWSEAVVAAGPGVSAACTLVDHTDSFVVVKDNGIPRTKK